MKTYITPYGLRPFRITKINQTDLGVQFKGKYKLPKNTTRADGKKWVKLNFWFNVEDIRTETV